MLSSSIFSQVWRLRGHSNAAKPILTTPFRFFIPLATQIPGHESSPQENLFHLWLSVSQHWARCMKTSAVIVICMSHEITEFCEKIVELHFWKCNFKPGFGVFLFCFYLIFIYLFTMFDYGVFNSSTVKPSTSSSRSISRYNLEILII